MNDLIETPAPLHAWIAGALRQHWGRRWVFLPACTSSATHAGACVVWSVGGHPHRHGASWYEVFRQRYGEKRVSYREPLFTGYLKA